MSFLFRMIGGIDPTLPYSKIDGEEIRAYENNNGKWKMYNGVSKVRRRRRERERERGKERDSAKSDFIAAL